MAFHMCRLVARTSSPTLVGEVRETVTHMYPELTNIRLVWVKRSAAVWKTSGQNWYDVTFEAD